MKRTYFFGFLFCMISAFMQNRVVMAQQTLKVNLSSTIRPVTHCASGSLYGVTETLPTDITNLVAPLNPCVFTQPALSGAGHQQPIGAAIPVSARLVSTTGKVMIRLADINAGWPYNWPGQSSWLSQVTNLINSKKASGRNNYYGYEIWNEPDGTWQTANGDFYATCWKPTYDLIRSLDPQAKIIGPSYSYYNGTSMKAFLTYCQNNNCLPDAICWHQWGSAGISSAIDSYRALEISLGISPRAISINEYSSTTHAYEGCPGVSVPFIAKFERKQVESACISWWFTNLPGRLGSLLTSSNQKGGGWWLYKWYGDMTGNMVSVTPPNDNSDGMDGFACLDINAQYASVCLGGNYTGAANVVVSGIPAAFGNQVNAKLEYVTWKDKDTAVASTTTISTTSYTVSNGAITVPVNVTNPLYAYRLYITPLVATNIPPVYSTTTAPVIDGVVDPIWSNYPSSTISNVVQGTVPNSTYLSATWKATWDANNLYVLVAVQDDVLVNTNQPQSSIYNDDGIEIYLDMGNTKTTTYGSNQFKYTFRWNDATVYELQHTATTGVKFAQTSQGITAGCTANCAAQGYTMEVAIPWSTLGTTAPVAGNLEGFDIGVNDDDTGTRNAKIAWNMTTDNDWQDPADFGTVIMENNPCTLPTANITPSGTASFCTGSSTVLNANTGTGLTYQWYNGVAAITGATSSSYTATAAGTYSVAVKNTANGCTATSAVTTVTVNSAPSAPTVTTPVTYCQNTTASALTASGTTLKWYTSATGGTANTTAPIPSTTTTGTTSYYVSQTNTSNCESPRATIAVTVNATPSAPTVTTPVTYCQNATASALTATGTSLKWYTSATGGTGSTAAPVPSTTKTGTTSYYVSQTSISSCEGSRANITITVNALPVITPYVQLNGNWLQQNTAQVCAGNTIALGPQPVVTNGWTWTGPNSYTSTARQISLANLTTAQGGVYTASYTDANGCTATANYTVTVNAIPSAPTVTSPVTYCQNATATALTATGASLNWYSTATGGTANTTAPTPSTSTTGTTSYYVSQTVNSCESPRSTIAVTVDTPPTASNAGTVQYITTTSTPLSANTPVTGTGTWTVVSGTATFTNPTSATTTVSGLSVGANVLEWTISNGVCPSSSSTVTINVGNIPDKQTITAYIATDFSATYTIATPSGVTNHWTVPSGATITSSNADSSQVTISFGTTGGTVSVAQTNSFGSTVDNATVSVGNQPVTQTISGPAYVATGSTGVTYSIPDNNGSTYHWILPAGATITSANADSSQITVSYGATVENGTISVTETNSYGSATSTLPVSIGNAPTSQSISGTDSVTANATGVTYSVLDNVGSSYHWSLPSGATITSANADSSQITISFGTAGGTVSVTETNPYGTTTSSSNVSVSAVTGLIGGTTGDSYEVYPNPFSDYATITLHKTTTEPITVTIINTHGVVCYSSSQYYTNQEFAIGSELTDGLYFVQLTYGNEARVLKLVKVK